MQENNSAVYVIRNLVTGRVYVGSSNNVGRRLKTHKRELARGLHHNEHLQRSWGVHGKESFVFDVVEICAADVRHIREQHWIDTLGAVDPDRGYNVMNLARKAVASPRRSQISKEMWNDKDFVAHIRKVRQATGKDPDFIAKSRAAANALWATPEHRAKMRVSTDRLKGSESFKETRRKLATDQWKNAESREKVTRAVKAQWQDPEAREKLLTAQAEGRKLKNFGQTMSTRIRDLWKDPEFRAKRIAALKAGQQKRKERVRNEIVSSMANKEAIGNAG